MAIISNDLIINDSKWLPCEQSRYLWLFQVIEYENAAGQEAERVINLGSPQVFVSLGDQQEAAGGAGVVAVSMEDLLNGTVTLICEEGQWTLDHMALWSGLFFEIVCWCFFYVGLHIVL